MLASLEEKSLSSGEIYYSNNIGKCVYKWRNKLKISFQAG